MQADAPEPANDVRERQPMLPPSTPKSEEYGADLSAYLRAAKLGPIEEFGAGATKAAAEVRRIDDIRERFENNLAQERVLTYENEMAQDAVRAAKMKFFSTGAMSDLETYAQVCAEKISAGYDVEALSSELLKKIGRAPTAPRNDGHDFVSRLLALKSERLALKNEIDQLKDDVKKA
jgi:hypothetical protein